VPAEATVNATKSGKLVLTSHQQRVLDEVAQDLSLGRNICLLGGKGSGKSHLLQELASHAEQDMLVFPVYQEMSGRDLLQRRGTTTDAAGSAEAHNATSLWRDSPLTKAARSGRLCVLDGVDRIDPQALLAIRTLISSPTYHAPEPELDYPGGVEAREVDLPSGERLQVHPDFRIIALGAPPVKSEDARVRYLNSDLNLSYH
jgi:MoxR-like ATPase